MAHRLTWMYITLLFSSTAMSALNSTDLSTYRNASTQLAVLIASAQNGMKAPQLKTAEVMKLVQTISDEERLLKADAYSVAEMGDLLDICAIANQASVSFLLFDLKANINPNASPQQVADSLIPLMKSNVLAFQDELKELQPFLLRCLAKEVSPMTKFLASLKPADYTEIRRQGLAKMRSGLVQVYAGALQTANDPDVRDDYRIALLSALAETSVAFASVLELPVRKQIRDAMTFAAASTTGQYKLYLDRIADALSDERCDGLCAAT